MRGIVCEQTPHRNSDVMSKDWIAPASLQLRNRVPNSFSLSINLTVWRLSLDHLYIISSINIRLILLDSMDFFPFCECWKWRWKVPYEYGATIEMCAPMSSVRSAGWDVPWCDCHRFTDHSPLNCNRTSHLPLNGQRTRNRNVFACSIRANRF